MALPLYAATAALARCYERTPHIEICHADAATRHAAFDIAELLLRCFTRAAP